jgi:hypothetical protein
MNPLETLVHGEGSTWRRFAKLSLACLVATLSACGGGGSGGASGGEGGGAGGAAPVTLNADVLPLAVGDRRFFRETAGANTGSVRSERVTEVLQIDGRSTFVVRDETGDLTYLVRTATGVSSVPGPGSSALETALGPVESLRVGQPAGQTLVFLDRTVAADVDGDGRTDSADLRYEVTFLGYEDISTGLGNFKAAAHVRIVVRATYRYAGRTVPQTIVSTNESWLAPGIGDVRSNTSFTIDGGAAQNTSEELTAYSVGGLRSERVAPVLLSSYPAADSFFPSTGFIELNYDEALDELSLKNPGGPTLVDAAGRVLPTTLRLTQNGSRLELVPLSPLPEGRYEVRTGTAITDLLNNPIAAVTRAFRVDSVAPSLVSSTPAHNAQGVALTGDLVMRFSEPVFAEPNSTVEFTLIGGSRPDGSTLILQKLPATIRGNEVVATLPASLQLNTDYTLSFSLGKSIVDASGKSAVSLPPIRFRTDAGPFSAPVPLLANASVQASLLGELNGDGRNDLVFVANQQSGGAFDTAVFVRYQQADGQFADPTRALQLPSQPICRLLGLVDVDGDGRTDLVLRCGASMAVARQQAGAAFVLETPASPINAFQIARFEWPGNTRNALLLLDGDKFKAVQRDATGNWATVLTVNAGLEPTGDWTLADLNGDGNADLVWRRNVGNGIDSEIVWAQREGSGFGPARTLSLASFGNRVTRMAVADVTGDGKPDLVFILPDNFGQSELAVLRQNAAGGFEAPVLYASFRAADAVAVADVDGDGRLDVVVAHSSEKVVGVYLQIAGGTFAAERRFDALSSAQVAPHNAVVVADLNADGRNDIVVGGDVLLGRPFAGPWPASTNQSAKTASLLADSLLARPTAVRALVGAVGRRTLWQVVPAMHRQGL